MAETNYFRRPVEKPKRRKIKGRTFEPGLSGGETWLFDKGISPKQLEYYDRHSEKWLPIVSKGGR